MLRQGSIITAQVKDPQGGNAKARPLVVITPTEDISSGEKLVAVAITGTYSDPLGDDEVALPYHPSGAARTGLRKPCVAKCSWLLALQVAEVIDVKGFLPTERLSAILARVSRLS